MQLPEQNQTYKHLTGPSVQVLVIEKVKANMHVIAR